VLVLEAGGSDRRFFVQMPLGYGKTFFDPRVNWNYRAEPDPGLGGNADHWPRGKVLGGSSSINAMVWIRGHPSDFDEWRDAGNPGWGYEDVLPIFKRIEDNEAGGDAWRGVGGPIHVTDLTRHVHPLTNRYIAAGVELGLPANPDFNGGNQEGIGVYQITTRDLGDGTTEITALSWWTDMDAIKEFVGDEPERAHYYTVDEIYLIDPPQFVEHHTVMSGDITMRRGG